MHGLQTRFVKCYSWGDFIDTHIGLSYSYTELGGKLLLVIMKIQTLLVAAEEHTLLIDKPYAKITVQSMGGMQQDSRVKSL